MSGTVQRFYFMPGDQIAYIPDHADNLLHPDVEFGFIVSVDHENKTAMCRYWNRHWRDLRTTANSECTRFENLIPYVSVPQTEVLAAIAKHISAEAAVRMLAAFAKRTHIEREEQEG
jgi:hypothetical protein